jgi:hypothetical protein
MNLYFIKLNLYLTKLISNLMEENWDGNWC